MAKAADWLRKTRWDAQVSLRPMEHDDGSLSWRALLELDWSEWTFDLRKAVLDRECAHFWLQRYDWDDGLQTTLFDRVRPRDLVGRINTLRISTISGRMPFGSSLLTTKDIEAGQGRCRMCGELQESSDGNTLVHVEMDSVSHLQTCSGNAHPSIGSRLSTLRSLYTSTEYSRCCTNGNLMGCAACGTGHGPGLVGPPPRTT